MSAKATAAITVTGKIGPGNTLTSKLFSGVTRFTIDVQNNKLTMITGNNYSEDVDISAATTLTDTISAAGGNHTVTIS